MFGLVGSSELESVWELKLVKVKERVRTLVSKFACRLGLAKDIVLGLD